MKLATFTVRGERSLGTVEANSIIPLGNALAGTANDMKSLIRSWEDVRPLVEAAVSSPPVRYDLSDVRLEAPIEHPGKIMCIGLNYLDHIEESGIERPEHQTWFCKLGNTVNGPFDPIQLPRASDKLDYEVELVAVIGRGGKHIALEDARDHVFGYCVGNDVSVRDWQLQTSQFVLGKSFDGHAPFGPWITTNDEIDNPHALGIRCLVNGELRQESNTCHLLFNLWALIHHLSQAMTLEPGDLIFTGTPGGVGWTMDPRQTLKSGDVVRCEIDQLGSIQGVVTPER